MNQNSMYRYWGAGERSARYSKKRKIPRGRNRSENIGLPFVKTDEISGLTRECFQDLVQSRVNGVPSSKQTAFSPSRGSGSSGQGPA